MIFCANPLAQYLPYKEEISQAVQKVLDSGSYILGEEVKAFEKEFSDYLGIDYVIGCASGTDALVLALRAMDVGPGDEVIVPSHTAVPTVSAVAAVGATPVYVDIEPVYFTLDPSLIEAACTKRTKAIIAVHLYGNAAPIEALMKIAATQNLRVIEDCAQAVGGSWAGKKLGTIGDVGCFSFFPTKNLGAIGDGGAVVCNDEELAKRLCRLRQYGWDDNRISQEPGINSRLDEIQAAILRVKLRYLDCDNNQRREQAVTYTHFLEICPIRLPSERDDAYHVYHLYVLQVDDRNGLISHLEKAGISAGIHYPVPVHKMTAYQQEGVSLPVTENIADKVLSLPLFPGMEKTVQTHIITTVRAFFDM